MAHSELDDKDVDAIMTRWPATMRILLAHGMHCVGCPIGGFHTLADAAAAHGIDEGQLISDVAAAIAKSGPKAIPGARHRR
ncbi:MAG: DUF1858 domain-containing protein [Devosia sp.]